MISKARELSVNPFKLNSLEVEELRRKLAKRANQRILRLERTVLSTGERASTLAAGEYAFREIAKLRGAGAKRFRERKLPLTDQTARQELYALQSFLSEKSSRYGKVLRQTSKTEKTFLERGVTVGSFRTFYNFLNSSTFVQLSEAIGDSSRIIDYYQRAYEKGSSNSKIQRLISEYLEEQGRLQEIGDPRGDIDLKSLAKKLEVNVL